MDILTADIDNFWDVAYREGDYLEHWESPHPPLELAAVIAAGLVPCGATVLDVGCGAGRETIFLAQCGFRAIGVDFSREALKIARRRAEASALAVEWRLGNVLELPLGDGAVDFVTDRGCFHVIPRRDRRRFAREIDRVLRPGGAILLRGAARDDEEAGLVAVDAEEIDRSFIAARFERGPLVPIVLAAPAEALEAKLVLLRKRHR